MTPWKRKEKFHWSRVNRNRSFLPGNRLAIVSKKPEVGTGRKAKTMQNCTFLHVLVWLCTTLAFHSWRAWPTDIKLFHRIRTHRSRGWTISQVLLLRSTIAVCVCVCASARTCGYRMERASKVAQSFQFLISMVWLSALAT